MEIEFKINKNDSYSIWIEYRFFIDFDKKDQRDNHICLKINIVLWISKG